jgi:hypothetical protein
MRAEIPTRSRPLRSFMHILALYALCSGALGCGDVHCPAGTALDGQYCRKFASPKGAGAGGSRSGGSANALPVAGSVAMSGGAGNRTAVGVPAGIGGGGSGVAGPIGMATSAGASGQTPPPMRALCPPNACMPGGSCVEGAADYACSCSAGYTGTNSKFCKKTYTLGPDTVSDDVTHLVWQLKLSTNNYTEPEAAAYCSALKLTTGSWRLPTKYELQTILDPTVAAPGPTIDLASFPGTPAAAFWSSTAFNPLPNGTSNTYWSVDFGRGDSTFSGATNKFLVRCVRSM